VLLQALALIAELLGHGVDEPVRQDVDLAQDHLVDGGVSVVPGLGEDRHRTQWRARAPFVPDDFGHGHASGAGDGIEQRLADAIEDRRGQRFAVGTDGRCLELLGERAERVEPAAEKRRRITDSTSARAASADSGPSRPPADAYWTEAASPWPTLPSSDASRTDSASPGCRTRRNPGLTGGPP
jgi:hypothetical protein